MSNNEKPEPELTSIEAIHQAVHGIIDANLGLEPTRAGIMQILAAEFQLTHNQAPETSTGAGTA